MTHRPSNAQAFRLLNCGLAFALPSLLCGCNGFVLPGTGDAGGGTQFADTAECATNYTDKNYGYGFDLPADAQLIRTKNETNSLTNSLWTFEEGGALINVVTRVQAASDGASLGDLVGFANDLALSAGADLSEEEVELSNGGEGSQTIVRYDGLTTFRVQGLADGRLYTVEAIVEESAQNQDLDSLLSAIVLSLCIGE